jgi:hypothetical protein
MEYKNRYNDVYSFTKDDDNNVLWEGDFRWCRMAWPNDYGPAYEQYLKDEPNPMSFEDFQEAVHKEGLEKYQALVKSDMTRIHMVDPSGGPYLTEGMHLGKWLGEEFQNLIIDEFKSIDTGFKIITKKCI